MFKSALRLWAPLLMLPTSMLCAQEAAPKSDPSQAIDTITPVPAPSIPYSVSGTAEMEVPKDLNINNGGGTISGDPETGILFGGPVKITGDNGLEIFSHTAQLDLKTKSVILEGDVTVYQGNLLQRGDRAIYHYDTKRLESVGLRASLDPFLLESGKFTAQREGDRQVYIGEDAAITTQDVQNPSYWFRASKTRIYPGEKVVFNNLRVYAGDIPVFWFPYLSQPLDAELGYHFLPGSRSAWGPFLLNTYGIMLGGERDPETGESHDAWLLSRWHFDLRAKRGVGAGLDLLDKKDAQNNEISGLSLYYMNDADPEYSRSGVPRTFSDPNRYRIQLKNRIGLKFEDDADWRLDTNLTYLSDEYYLEDLEENRYRTDPAPDNTLGIYRRSASTLLSMFTRFQLNDYYRSDTRMPEIALDIARAPLFDLPILHEGSISLGLVGEQADNFTRNSIINPLKTLSSGPVADALLDQLTGYERSLAEEMVNLPLLDPRRKEISQQLLDSNYARFHAYEQFSMPTTIGDFLSFTPEAGIGYTRYGAVDGPSDGFDRTHMHVGAEAALKFSKDLGNYRNHALGLDGLMHVFQPYTNWSVISTNDFETGQPGVDRLTPTTRPRPLDPTRFTAIDQMDSWNVVRMGARNRLITRRDNQSYEWLYIDTYVDAFINDPEGERNVSNLYNDVRWHPVPWMNLDFETQFPIADGGSGFTEFTSRARFLLMKDFELSIGYRWLGGHPYLQDSSRIDLQSYTRLNDDWGIGTRHSLELDDNTLEYQQYTLHRDLGSWVAGMGFTMRDNRLKDEYGVIFTLTLKDFPSVSLPFEYGGE